MFLYLKDGSPARDLAGYHVYRRGKKGDWTRLSPAVATGMDFQVWR